MNKQSENKDPTGTKTIATDESPGVYNTCQSNESEENDVNYNP